MPIVTRRRLSNDEGFTLVIAMVMLTVTLVLGLALAAVVGTQTSQSRQEMRSDNAGNLAEDVLNSAASALAARWPVSNVGGAASTSGLCRDQNIMGSFTAGPASGSTSLAQDIFATVKQGLDVSSQDTADATWSVNVCDAYSGAGSAARWSNAMLNGASYDTTPASAPPGTPRQLWVRAQVATGTTVRAVAARVQAGQQSVFPPGYAIITGALSANADVGATLSSLTNSGLLSGLTTSLLGTNGTLATGAVGLRCGLLSLTAGQLCLAQTVAGVGATLGAAGLPSLSMLLLSPQYQQYGNPTVLPDATVGILRAQAKLAGTYYPTTPNATNCPPLTATNASSIIFIEQVGTDGKGTCNYDVSSNPTVKAIIVGSGTINLTATGTSKAKGILTGVVYGLNRVPGTLTDAGLREVVSLKNSARVSGGVYVDGTGSVGIYPPTVAVTDIIYNIPLVGPILKTACLLLGPTCGGLDNIVKLVIRLTNVALPDIVNQLLLNLTPYGPSVVYDATVVNAVTTATNSFIVPGTFRSVSSVTN